MSETIYLQLKRNNKTSGGEVRIEEVGKVACSDKAKEMAVKKLIITNIPDIKGYKKVMSATDVINIIQQYDSKLEINVIGESEFIIEYFEKSKKNTLLIYLKVVLISIIIFLGSSFSIMTYNNDVGIPELFKKIYMMLTGENGNGTYILEISYSIGLTTGIVAFYNHFGGIRFNKEPSPIEVSMRAYENDIDTAVIENDDREGN